MPRTFNGSSDFVAIGNPSALSPATPLIAAAIIYVNALNGTVVGKFQSSGGTSAGWQLAVNATGKILFTKIGVVDIPSSTITLSTGKWYLIAAYVAATTVRFFAYDYAANTFTVESVSNSSASRTTTNSAFIGKFINASGASSTFFNGDIEVVAAWVGGSAAPSDDQIHNLAFELGTWYEFANPTSLWILDQQSTSEQIIDEEQVANQSAITGTSVSSRSCPIWTPGQAALAAL